VGTGPLTTSKCDTDDPKGREQKRNNPQKVNGNASSGEDQYKQ
jgi:hypothetical protein